MHARHACALCTHMFSLTRGGAYIPGAQYLYCNIVLQYKYKELNIYNKHIVNGNIICLLYYHLFQYGEINI